MPGPVLEINELQHGTIAPDQKVGRYFKLSNGLEIGVGGSVQLIAEKLLDSIATELARGQADIVNNKKRWSLTGGAFIEVGRGTPAGRSNTTGSPHFCGFFSRNCYWNQVVFRQGVSIRPAVLRSPTDYGTELVFTAIPQVINDGLQSPVKNQTIVQHGDFTFL